MIKYIQANYSSFINVLKGRIYEVQNGGPIDISVECATFLSTELPKLTCYGGAESLEAISALYNVNIVIINDDNYYSLACKFNEKYKRTIMLAYRNKNHYDSVIEVSEANISEKAGDIATQEIKKKFFLSEYK